MVSILLNETLQGVLGSGENGFKKYREQRALGQKYQGAGSKGKKFREQGAEDSGHCIKQSHTIFLGLFRLASLRWFSDIYFSFPPAVNRIF